MHSATRYRHLNKPFRPLAIGLTLTAVCIVFSLSLATTSLADDTSSTLTLTWDASTGADVTNYTIYYGTSSGGYSQAVQSGPVTQTTITGLTGGATYFLAATASDSTGMASDYSNEISFSVPAGRPFPGAGLPELSLVQSGSTSVVRWPTNYSGFTLQWSSSPTGEWINLAPDPCISGSYFAYTNSTSAEQGYYRLKE